MSKYQYYEFHAIDRPLTKAEQEMLRGTSLKTLLRRHALLERDKALNYCLIAGAQYLALSRSSNSGFPPIPAFSN
jgi:hypothetical protein